MLTHTEQVQGWHVPLLARDLRQADIDEVKAMADLDPLRGLVEAVAYSHVSYSIMEEDVPVAMYGARKVQDDVGVVWMLGSPAIERCSIQFLRNSQEYIDALHDEVGCRTLGNYTDKRNKVHHRWLRWTGFQFGQEVNIGPYDMPFYEIYRVKE